MNSDNSVFLVFGDYIVPFPISIVPGTTMGLLAIYLNLVFGGASNFSGKIR
jgi:hypothetical protein